MKQLSDPTGLIGLGSYIAAFVHAYPKRRPSDVVAYIQRHFGKNHSEYEIRKRLQWLVEHGFLGYTMDWRLIAYREDTP